MNNWWIGQHLSFNLSHKTRSLSYIRRCQSYVCWSPPYVPVCTPLLLSYNTMFYCFRIQFSLNFFITFQIKCMKKKWRYAILKVHGRIKTNLNFFELSNRNCSWNLNKILVYTFVCLFVFYLDKKKWRNMRLKYKIK